MKAVRRHATRLASTTPHYNKEPFYLPNLEHHKATQETQTDVTIPLLQTLRLLASNQLSQHDTFDVKTAYINEANSTYQASAVFTNA